MAPPPSNFRPEPSRHASGQGAARAGSASSRAASAAPTPAPGLSTDRAPRGVASGTQPGRVEAPAARAVASISLAEAQARLRATMPAHLAAAAKVARVTPRVTRTLESGELEIVYDARWGLVRGRPCLTWNESTRELSVSVKHLFREALVHTFPIQSPEHYGVIAQTAMSLVVGRAK